MRLVSRSRFPSSSPNEFVDWEETDCPLCEGNKSKILLEAQDPLGGDKGLWFAVVRCTDCGLCYTNPRPSPGCIGRFYPETYRPHQTSRVSKTSQVSARRRNRSCALPRSVARKHGQVSLPLTGKILDFGCGGGHFLEQMQQQGWDVTGVDASFATVQRLREQRGLRVFAGSLPHPELESEKFDVITMWQSLEHVHAPRQTLEASRELLVPEGKLIVAVPNIESLPYQWFGADWFALDVPRHLTHFSPITLVAMLEHCGFDVQSLRMVRHSSWLRMSAQRAARMKGSGMQNRLLQTGLVSRLACWYTSLAGKADAMVAVAVPSPAA